MNIIEGINTFESDNKNINFEKLSQDHNNIEVRYKSTNIFLTNP